MATYFITSRESCERYVEQIRRLRPVMIGFDVESTDERKADIISLAVNTDVYIFSLAHLWPYHETLIKLVCSAGFPKVTVNAGIDNARCMAAGFPRLNGLIDIADLAAMKGLPRSLKKLYAACFPKAKPLTELYSKEVKIRIDWTKKDLDEKLIQYAAEDARASLACLRQLLGIN